MTKRNWKAGGLLSVFYLTLQQQDVFAIGQQNNPKSQQLDDWTLTEIEDGPGRGSDAEGKYYVVRPPADTFLSDIACSFGYVATKASDARTPTNGAFEVVCFTTVPNPKPASKKGDSQSFRPFTPQHFDIKERKVSKQGRKMRFTNEPVIARQVKYVFLASDHGIAHSYNFVGIYNKPSGPPFDEETLEKQNAGDTATVLLGEQSDMIKLEEPSKDEVSIADGEGYKVVQFSVPGFQKWMQTPLKLHSPQALRSEEVKFCGSIKLSTQSLLWLFMLQGELVLQVGTRTIALVHDGADGLNLKSAQRLM